MTFWYIKQIGSLLIAIAILQKKFVLLIIFFIVPLAYSLMLNSFVIKTSIHLAARKMKHSIQ